MITSQPASQTIGAGSNATFSVSASGTPTFTYQWYFNGTAIPAATAASYTLNTVQAGNAGAYNVIVANDYGTAVSSNAVLTLAPTAPIFTLQPVGLPVMLGGQATFTATAMGSMPIAYQWQLNGSPIPGATATALTITNVQSTSLPGESAVR